MVVTERTVMAPLPLTARLLRLVVPPTMPPKLTAPVPCAIARLWLPAVVPFTVLLKVTLLSVVVSVVLPPSVTAPV